MGETRARHGILAAAALFLVGCVPADESPKDGGGGGSDGGGGDAAMTVTYTRDIQPIFMTKCATCHTTEKLGNHNIGSTYAEVNNLIHSVDSEGCWKDVEQTMPRKVGECALILIKNGRMPQFAGCTATPPLAPELCLSPAEIAKVEAWVTAGLPQ